MADPTTPDNPDALAVWRSKLLQHRAELEQGPLNGTTPVALATLQIFVRAGGSIDEFQDIADAVSWSKEESHTEGLLSEKARNHIASQSFREAPAPAQRRAEVPGQVEGAEIDVEEAKRHLRALGITDDVPVILCAYGETNSYFPDREDFFTAIQKRQPWAERNLIPYNWAAFEKRHAERCAEGTDRPWQQLQRKLRNQGTQNMGFIGQPGGTCTKARGGEIKSMRYLTYEVDANTAGQAPSHQEQRQAWKKAGLPEPSLSVNTGGKSIHFYWVLSEAVPLEVGTAARKRLFHGIEQANPGLICDRSMASGHQPQRLAGYVHPKTGRRSVVESDSGLSYSLQRLLEVLPELPERETQGIDGDGELFRDDEEDAKPGEDITLPLLDGRGQPLAVPLTLALSAKTRLLIEKGQEAGSREGVGRCVRAHSICRSLQAAAAQFEHLEQPFTGSVEELYEQFVVASRIADDYTHGDLDRALAKHWNDGPHGEGELSKLALIRAIKAWARNRQQDEFSNRTKAKRNAPPREPEPGEPDFRAEASEAGAQWNKQGTKFIPRRGTQVKWGERKLSLGKRLDFIDRAIAQLTRNERNTFRRKARIRAVLGALKLSRQLREPEISSKILEALDEKSGNAYQPLDAAARLSMQAPKVNWLINGLVPANDLTFVGGRAKVGKTRLAVGLIRALLSGDDFLGFSNPENGRVVIFVSDDQSDGDTHDMLQAAGIWDHERLLWSRRFRLNDKNLDSLLATIDANPGAVVVLDSLRSITRSCIADENSPEIGELLYDLKQSVIDAGGSLLLVHHCNKGNDSVGMEALSGHNSIPGAGNTVLTMHYLPGRDGSPDKTTTERRLFREARSGQGFDLVIKGNDGLSYEKVETFEERRSRLGNAAASQELTKAICSEDEHLTAALQVLLELFESGNAPGISVLDLCVRTGLCRSSVQKLADLNAEESKHQKRLQKALARLVKQQKGKGEALLVASAQRGSGQARTLYALTRHGAELVKEQLEG